MNKPRVAFAENSKQYDGMHPRFKLLDAIVFAYFEDKVIGSEQDMMHQVSQCVTRFNIIVTGELITTLEKYCNMLLERVSTKKSTVARVPVQLYGGGRGMSLSVIHCAHFSRMSQWFHNCLLQTLQTNCNNNND